MSKFDDPALVQEICDRIAEGQSMVQICADERMPSTSDVYRRMASDEDFGIAIARAREAQQDYEADHIIEMADLATPEDWQAVKLRIWARQWRAAKLAPRKYGDKLDLTSGGDKLGMAEALAARRERAAGGGE